MRSRFTKPSCRRSIRSNSISATARCIRRPIHPATRPASAVRRGVRCCRCRIRCPRSPARCSAKTTSDLLDNDLIRNYAKDGDPIGERIIVHGQVLDENRQARSQYAGRILAGQCRGPLPAQERHLSRADRSEFRRLRPHADRRATAITISAPSSPAPIRGATTSTAGARPTSTSRSSARASRSD